MEKKYMWIVDNCNGDYYLYDTSYQALKECNAYLKKTYSGEVKELKEAQLELFEGYLRSENSFCADEVIYCWRVPVNEPLCD